MNPSGSILAFAFDQVLTNASSESFQGILVTSVRILAPSNALRKKVVNSFIQRHRPLRPWQSAAREIRVLGNSFWTDYTSSGSFHKWIGPKLYWFRFFLIYRFY